MKIISLLDLVNTVREVQCPRGGFTSYRYVLAEDGMGFGVHKTCIPKGERQRWHYKNHLEACFCVSGLGRLWNLETGEGYYIRPDSAYLLDQHDPHEFQALTDVVLISVFNPPCQGVEVHLEDGSYAASIAGN